MNKTVFTLLISLLLFSLSACEKDDDNEGSSNNANENTIEYTYQVEKIEVLEMGYLWEDSYNVSVLSEDSSYLGGSSFRNVVPPAEGGLLCASNNSIWNINFGSSENSSVAFTAIKHPKDHMVGQNEFRIAIQSYKSYAPFEAIIKGIRREK